MAATGHTVDDAPFTAFHWRLAIFGNGGLFVDGYILSNIAVALTLLGPQLGLGSFQEGLIGGGALAGILFGGLLGGYISDKIGRRTMFTIDLAVFVIASILQIFIGGFLALFALRIVLGLAVGVDYSLAGPLMAELTPRRQRGPVLAAAPAAWFLGAACAYVVGYFMLVGLGQESWRWMLGSSAIPALIILLMRIGIPESPRWLLNHGRQEEAREVVREVFGEEARVEDITGEEEGGGFRKVFEAGYLKRTVFAGLFWLLQVTPLFAIYTFAPAILEAFDLNEGNQAYLGSVLISLMFFVGGLPVIFFLINGWGRRPVIIAGFVAATIAFGVLALPGTSTLLVIACFVFYALVMGGAQTLQTVYPSELFPTGVRATAVGVATAISRVGAFVGTFLLPIGLEALGVNMVMLISAILSALGVWLCVAWAPETRGKTLNEASSVSEVASG